MLQWYKEWKARRNAERLHRAYKLIVDTAVNDTFRNAMTVGVDVAMVAMDDKEAVEQLLKEVTQHKKGKE